MVNKPDYPSHDSLTKGEIARLRIVRQHYVNAIKTAETKAVVNLKGMGLTEKQAKYMFDTFLLNFADFGQDWDDDTIERYYYDHLDSAEEHEKYISQFPHDVRPPF